METVDELIKTVTIQLSFNDTLICHSGLFAETQGPPYAHAIQNQPKQVLNAIWNENDGTGGRYSLLHSIPEPLHVEQAQ
jgi:hypothetical protein